MILFLIVKPVMAIYDLIFCLAGVFGTGLLIFFFFVSSKYNGL
jgi:hypothetical protein